MNTKIKKSINRRKTPEKNEILSTKESSSTISNNDTNSINDESSTELEINNINNLTFGSNNSNIILDRKHRPYLDVSKKYIR